MKACDYLECLEALTARDGLPYSDLHPVPLADVLTVEGELGADLPEAYEEFLATVGTGCEFGGTGWWYHFDITRPGNVIDVTRRLTASREGAASAEFPEGFLAIYDACDGEVFGLRLDGSGRYGEAVWAWDTEELKCRKVSDTFHEFLDYLLGEEAETLTQLV